MLNLLHHKRLILRAKTMQFLILKRFRSFLVINIRSLLLKAHPVSTKILPPIDIITFQRIKLSDTRCFSRDNLEEM